jgi:hypothetical protein
VLTGEANWTLRRRLDVKVFSARPEFDWPVVGARRKDRAGAGVNAAGTRVDADDAEGGVRVNRADVLSFEVVLVAGFDDVHQRQGRVVNFSDFEANIRLQRLAGIPIGVGIQIEKHDAADAAVGILHRLVGVAHEHIGFDTGARVGRTQPDFMRSGSESNIIDENVGLVGAVGKAGDALPGAAIDRSFDDANLVDRDVVLGAAGIEIGQRIDVGEPAELIFSGGGVVLTQAGEREGDVEHVEDAVVGLAIRRVGVLPADLAHGVDIQSFVDEGVGHERIIGHDARGLDKSLRWVIGGVQVGRVVVSALGVVGASAAVLVEGPELVAGFVSERFGRSIGRDDHEPSAGKGKRLVEGAAGGEEFVVVVGVVHDEDGEGPVGVGLLPAVVVVGANVAGEIPRGVEIDEVEEVVEPARAGLFVNELVAGTGDGLVASLDRNVGVSPVDVEVEQVRGRIGKHVHERVFPPLETREHVVFYVGNAVDGGACAIPVFDFGTDAGIRWMIGRIVVVRGKEGIGFHQDDVDGDVAEHEFAGVVGHRTERIGVEHRARL